MNASDIQPSAPAPLRRLQMKLDHTLPGLAAASILSAALLAACGGGGGAGGGIGSGGTGNSPGNGVASGTVNGFGSIFVGGVRCDDTRAKLAYNTAAGTPESGTPEIKLGMSLQVTFDAASNTCKVLQALVDPEVVGIVTSLSPLTVARQRVVIVTDASLAPPTVLEGWDSAAGLKVGDRLEVHGKAITVSGLAAVQATRIERKPATQTWVRAKGKLAGLSATQFTLGGLTVKRDGSTRLDPASLVLAEGETVAVWSNAPVAVDGSITATAIRLGRTVPLDQQGVRIEGPAAGCTASPCTQPTVDGVRVELSGAVFANGANVDVANGVGLRVEGTFDSARGLLVATKASVRPRDPTAGQVTLIGMVSDFVSTTDFNVRGVQLTTNAGTSVAGGCTIAAGAIVSITGTVADSQVVAQTVACPALADGLTLDVFGALVSVDATAKTFTLSEGAYRNFSFTWDDDTVFGTGLSGATLAGAQRVGLRAVVLDLANRKLLVKRIIADPTPTLPAGVTQLFGNFGLARDVTAGSLAVNRIQLAIVPGTTALDTGVVDGTPVRTWFYRTGPLQPWTALKITKVSWN